MAVLSCRVHPRVSCLRYPSAIFVQDRAGVESAPERVLVAVLLSASPGNGWEGSIHLSGCEHGRLLFFTAGEKDIISCCRTEVCISTYASEYRDVVCCYESLGHHPSPTVTQKSVLLLASESRRALLLLVKSYFAGKRAARNRGRGAWAGRLVDGTEYVARSLARSSIRGVARTTREREGGAS